MKANILTKQPKDWSKELFTYKLILLFIKYLELSYKLYDKSINVPLK